MSTGAERSYDDERVQRAVKALRAGLRAIDRDLKNAQDGGLTVDDAQALRALAVRAEQTAASAANTLHHVIAREQGRREREAAV